MYEKYGDAIFGILLRTTRNRELSEEVLQITMLKAWNKIDTYNSEKSKLYTWLATIARNSAFDKMRLKSYSRQKETDSIENSVYDLETVSFSQAEMDVQKLIIGLDEKYKIILKLIYLQGFTHVDAAKEIGIPVGTLKTRLRNALKILREELKNERLLFLSIIIIALIANIFLA